MPNFCPLANCRQKDRQPASRAGMRVKITKIKKINYNAALQAYDLICQFERQRLKAYLLAAWPKKAKQLLAGWLIASKRFKRQFPCQ